MSRTTWVRLAVIAILVLAVLFLVRLHVASGGLATLG